MIRVLTVVLLVVALPIAAEAQNQRRPDEYSKATGFSVDFNPGGQDGDEGWEHISDALLTISHSAPTPDVKPAGLPETIVKFSMRDADGNRAGVELGPCRNLSTAVCLVITSVDLPKSSADWLKPLLHKNAKSEHRDLLITVAKANGEKRSYNLFDCLPASFSYVEVGTGGSTSLLWTIEVRVSRVEMA